MKKMFLASSFVDVADLFVTFTGGNCAGKTVTLIPTASLVEEVRFYVATGKEALEDRGLLVDELEVSTASKEEIDSKLRKSDYIYITGGNTFFLLQELKRTGADKIIEHNRVMSGSPLDLPRLGGWPLQWLLARCQRQCAFSARRWAVTEAHTR